MRTTHPPISPPVLLYFEEQREQGVRIAQAASLCHALVQRHRFPDEEIKLRLPPQLPEQIFLLCSLNQPNEKLIELLLTAKTARTLGTRHITLVAPYLGYMRQDAAFEAGEAVSQKIIGNFLASLFDAIVSVDPHLHRVSSLQEAVPVAAHNAYLLTGAQALSDWIVQQHTNPFLIGPDEESAQWVSEAAARNELDYAVCKKIRHNDTRVQITLPEANFLGRQVVLLDDVISSGNTIAQATRQLLTAGAASVDVAVTHALFNSNTQHRMREAGVGALWSTDCVPHPTNAISMAQHIATTLKSIQTSYTAPHED